MSGSIGLNLFGWFAAPPEDKSIASRYLAAALFVLLALAATCLLRWFDSSPPQLFLFIVAVIAATRNGGFGPGLFAVAAAALIADFFFIPPLFDLRPDPATAPVLLAFMLCALVGSLIVFPRTPSARKADAGVAAPYRQARTAQGEQIAARAAATAGTPAPRRTVLIMGLAGAGKTTLSNALAPLLNAVQLNGDEVRANLDRELGFSHHDRVEHARRIGWLCNRITATGTYVVADFICPTTDTRAAFGADDTFVVWVDRIRESRFADTNAMFQAPDRYDIRVTEDGSPQYWAERILEKLR